MTDSISPSQLVPGSSDSVVVTGPAGISVTALTGTANLAAAQFAGNVILSGSVAAGTLVAGSAITGGLLQLAAGSSLQSTTATLAGGSLLVNGTNTRLGVAGQLTLGSLQAGSYGAAANLSVTAGGHASVLAVMMATANSQIYVDPSSILEVGNAGTGATGRLTVDTGYLLLGQGNANEYGAVTDNGNIYAFGGTLAVGTVTGVGHLGISSNATMLLEGPVGAGEQIMFAGFNATLAIAAEAYAPQGIVNGFAAGDAIDFRGSLISAAIYNASGSNAGVLTLYYGSQIAAQLNLAGNYSTSVFLTAGDGSNGTLINVATAVAGSGTASPGTSTPDQYAWVASGSGAWGSAANWQDQTTGTQQAAIAPGARNAVSIAASQGGFTVIAGPGNAASLSLTGQLALTGTFAIGTLAVGGVSGTNFTPGGLDLLAGTAIRAQAASVGSGAISAAGSGAVLSVAGTLSMGGGISGVGLPVTALTATAGGRIQAAGLVIGGGSGNSVTTDPAGSVEFGTLGTAVAGAVTVDPGASITGNGSINPFGAVVDNGSITATGGVLTLGIVTGTGALSIGAGALELTYATALPIAFTSASSTLAIGGPAATPTGILSGLVPGDVIDLLGSPLTSVQLIAGTASSPGTLVMLYNGVAVGRLLTSSSFNKVGFATTPDGQGGTDISFLVGSGGGGGTGQTGTDPLVFTGAANGNWSAGVNWNDTVTAKIASLPPGTQTAARITGPSGANFQSITGTGTCASLLLNGNGFFFGSFTAGSLSIGQDATAAAPAAAGTLVTTVLTTFTLGSCLIADGAFLAAGSKTAINVAGTLAVSDGGLASVLAFTAHAAGQAGALSLGGGSVSVDSLSTFEIGTLGGAAAGLLTVDAGASASGFGTLGQLGTLAVNGVVTAAGGTLVLGATSGSGTLAIGTEAALALTAANSVPIVMTGAGAKLILQGAAAGASGVISGFAPGDSIVTGNTPVDSASYQPGAGGLGTLTLSEAGQVVETLLLAGNYAGEAFAVQPAGTGAVVVLTAASGGNAGGFAPAGTVTPDQYVWTGADGVLWSDAKNWIDTTQSKTAAAVAPGQNNRVTIAIPAGSAAQVTGPANAASLTLTGSLALLGATGIGTLAVGTAQQSGVLAMGGGTSIAAAGAVVLGGIAGLGGTLAIGGTLILGQAGLAGLVSATGSTSITAGTILLQGSGSQLQTDTLGAIEIGGLAAGTPGTVSIDSAGLLAGTGAVNPSGQIADYGMITASGGTLVLGTVSGSGTLLVGVDAGLVLGGAVAAGITVDFAAGGTLNLAGGLAGFAAAIADFGPGDQILLPVIGATQASYAATGPGLGVLTITGGNQSLAQLTLLGSQADFVFSVAGSAGGGTILTAAPSNTAGEGGSTLGNYPTISGGFVITPNTLYGLAPVAAQPYLVKLNTGPNNAVGNDYEYFLAGETTVVGPALYSTIGQFGVDVEVIGPLTGEVAQGGFGPGTNMVLQPGYDVLLAVGSEPINLIDQGVGASLLIGNAGADVLATFASNDTLVGAAGANTVFYASGGQNVVIQGGGNDTITTNDNAQITTSGGGHTNVFLGAATNTVVSNGTDQIICGNIGISNNTVTENAVAGSQGDTVFGPLLGSLIYNGGAAPGTVVGAGGQVVMNGGSGNGNELWAANSYAQYNGGSGSATVVGGSQALFVQGGTGPTTVFGGTGINIIEGTAGNSDFVVGLGPSTILAAAGNTVWVLGSAQVSVSGSAGAIIFAGQSSASNIFQANTGSETLWGGIGNDTFYAGSGSGTFVADGGADVFNFSNGNGGGMDDIVGFLPGLDVVALHGYGASAPQLTVQNGSTFCTLSDGTNVEFYNVTNLTAASFRYT